MLEWEFDKGFPCMDINVTQDVNTIFIPLELIRKNWEER